MRLCETLGIQYFHKEIKLNDTLFGKYTRQMLQSKYNCWKVFIKF